MKKTEYRDCLDRLCLNQVQASKLFRVNERSGRRWALNEASMPFSTAALLRLLVTGERVTIKALEEMKD